MDRCKAATKAGTPCPNRARTTGFCFTHDPELQDAKKESSRRGGLNKRTTIRASKYVPETLRPVLEQIKQAMDEVHSGQIPAQRGISLAQLANALCRVYELAALEQRIQKLEDAAHG
jgi:hypothetical protein